MVAEPVAETPVAEVESQAPAPEQTQEIPAEEEPSLDEEEIASLREQGFISGEPESEAAAAATEGTPDLKTLTPEQALEQGRRQEREAITQRQAVENRQRYEEGVRNSLLQRKAAVTKALTDTGVDAQTALWVAQQFDEHHGQALAANRFDLEAAQKQQAQAFVNTIYPAVTQALGAQLGKKFAEEGYHDSWEDMVASVVKHAREGYVTPAQAKKAADEAVVKYAAKLKAQGILPQGRTSAAPTGRGAIDIRNADAKLMDPNTPIEEVMRIRAAQRAG